MPDPNIVSDPTALYVSAGNGLAFLSFIGWQLKKMWKEKNGNNPHSKNIDELRIDIRSSKSSLFNKIDELRKAMIYSKDEIKDDIHKIDKTVGILEKDTKRIEETLEKHGTALNTIQILHGQNHPKSNINPPV